MTVTLKLISYSNKMLFHQQLDDIMCQRSCLKLACRPIISRSSSNNAAHIGRMQVWPQVAGSVGVGYLNEGRIDKNYCLSGESVIKSSVIWVEAFPPTTGSSPPPPNCVTACSWIHLHLCREDSKSGALTVVHAAGILSATSAERWAECWVVALLRLSPARRSGCHGSVETDSNSDTVGW